MWPLMHCQAPVGGWVALIGGEGVGNGSGQTPYISYSLPSSSHPLSHWLTTQLLSPWKPTDHAHQGIRKVICTLLLVLQFKSPSLSPSTVAEHLQGASLPSLPPFAADPRDPLSKPGFPPSCPPLNPQLF